MTRPSNDHPAPGSDYMRLRQLVADVLDEKGPNLRDLREWLDTHPIPATLPHTSLTMRHPHGDHTVSLARRGDRVVFSLEPDRPLDYGYDDAGTTLDQRSIERLITWATTGQVEPR